LRVLLFGTYERDYPRIAVVRSALRRAGVEVVERHVSVWDDRRHKWSLGVAAIPRLLAAEARLLARPRESFDLVLVAYPGHLDLPVARRTARGRAVVFDPLVSLADTLVEDRGRFRRGSLVARALAAVDRFALRRADLVVADTAAQAVLYRSLGARRVEVCLVGAEERLFTPVWRRPAEFVALFVGKLIPLHGIPTLVQAARRAPEVAFRVVGSGQLEGELTDAPANLERVPWIDYARLPAELGRCGCALGIFGTSAKAQRVIPNKVFQALACGAPVVTADTPAAQELLVNGESALLVPPGDPDALAEAVRRLADDDPLAERVAEGGTTAYRRHASEEVLGARWRALLESVR
jgi:glycosyltransferase involved in cell wall biosynthesis